MSICANFQLADGSPLIAYPRNNGWNQQFHFDCAGTLDTDLSALPEEADDSGESELLCADDGSSKPLSFFDLFKTIEPTFSLDQMTDTESWGSYLSAPEAEYHPFAGDEATLLLMSKKSERYQRPMQAHEAAHPRIHESREPSTTSF